MYYQFNYKKQNSSAVEGEMVELANMLDSVRIKATTSLSYAFAVMASMCNTVF